MTVSANCTASISVDPAQPDKLWRISWYGAVAGDASAGQVQLTPVISDFEGWLVLDRLAVVSTNAATDLMQFGWYGTNFDEPGATNPNGGYLSGGALDRSGPTRYMRIEDFNNPIYCGHVGGTGNLFNAIITPNTNGKIYYLYLWGRLYKSPVAVGSY